MDPGTDYEVLRLKIIMTEFSTLKLKVNLGRNKTERTQNFTLISVKVSDPSSFYIHSRGPFRSQREPHYRRTVDSVLECDPFR